MTTWEEIRDEVAGMLADGKPLEDVLAKLEKRKNEMAKANLLKAMDEMKNPKPMTNEEWFCSLDTEQKAEWLQEHMDCVGCPASQEKCHRYYDACKEVMMEWLKQPHTDS